VARAKALAVLPFRFRGPADESFIADALLDELTDVLSRTRGLKVSGSGASSRFADAGDRDPRVLGVELGVDVVVDGSIQLAGKRLRIAARLLDVHTGFQLWSERFDGELEDVFELQDKLGQRIAEALRVELEIISHGGLADPEALESYLRARHAKLRWRLRGPEGAVAHYQRVLERAPDFRPAIAGYALALIRAWFLPTEPHHDDLDWPRAVAVAVERAMNEAPEFPESRIAAASWAVQAGDYRSAAEHLREALRVAPTCALAHEYLGRLQMEAALPEKGLRHLMLALELDPQLAWCHVDIARYRALQGDMVACHEHMDRLLGKYDHHDAMLLYEMRFGAWTREPERIRRALAELDDHHPDELVRAMRNYGPPLLEPYDPDAIAQLHGRSLDHVGHSRLRTLMLQLWAEQTGYWGDRERTLAHLEAAADLVLVDLAWLDGCPLFEFVRDDPRFGLVRARVLARCEAIWAAD
jgi:eukaryotic-like serine/threonine-protein kinase